LLLILFKNIIKKIDIPPIPEFLEMANDAGMDIFACTATVDMLH